MGISNTNYNSILHINANRKEVKEFRQSIIMSGVPPANRLSQLAAKPIYNLEDDLINQSTYKSISELKETIEESDPNQKQGGNFATIGVVAIDPKNGWWYNINMRVADDTEAASFLLYDTEAVKHLGVTTSDIRLAQLTKPSVGFENSELLSMQTDSVQTHNGTRSPSVKILAADVDRYSTPKEKIISEGWSKKLIELYPDSSNASSSKCRKVVNGDNANANKTVEE
ncbi:hypothetical protein AHAS_Ahas11G0295700 [Arachis hypogaea]